MKQGKIYKDDISQLSLMRQRFPNMKRQEEQILARRYIALGGQDKPSASAIREPDPDPKIEQELISIESRFATSHLPLIQSIARKFTGSAHSYEDLVSEGVKGIYKALGNFDPERKLRFSTHALSWIRAEMYDINQQSSTGVKFSGGNLRRYARNTLALTQKIRQSAPNLTENEVFLIAAQNVLEKERNKPNNQVGKRSAQEIADLARNFNAYSQAPASMEAPAWIHSEENSLIERLTDPETMNLDDQMIEAEKSDILSRSLKDALANLQESYSQKTGKAKENGYRALIIFIARNLYDPDGRISLAQALQHEFGIDENFIPEQTQDIYTTPTLEDLSAIYSVSRERIRQIEFKLLEEITLKTKQNHFNYFNPPLSDEQTQVFTAFS